MTPPWTTTVQDETALDPPICIALDRELDLSQKKSSHTWESTRASLHSTRRCGCRLCGIARVAICDHASGATAGYGNAEGNLYASIIVKNRRSGLEFSCGGEEMEVLMRERQMGDNDPRIPVATSISGNTGSEQSFQIALRWLENCVMNHGELCASRDQRHNKPRLPTRVIDVRSNDNDTVRIIETGAQRDVYACLSHCWGNKGHPLKTTLEPNTLATYQEGIAWAELPKTFQEAIIMARRFSIQYLWIDSLCIIQDSFDDWQTQSALMGKIYQNALLTFAASASSGPEQGLFRLAGSQHIDSVSERHSTWLDLKDFRFRKVIPHRAAELPLMERGWVFQERLLSRRFLHFSENELVWECMEETTCECGGLHLQPPTPRTWLHPKNRLHPATITRSSSEQISGAWHAAVRDYSRMALTKPADILPAISGVASTIRDATGWTYIAGLWEENMIADLAWCIKLPCMASRPAEWRAPTFSWASVLLGRSSSSVSYEALIPRSDVGEWQMHAIIVEAGSTPLGSSDTGKLKSAYLTLRGDLIQGELRRIEGAVGWDDAWTVDWIDREVFVVYSHFYPDVNLEEDLESPHDGDAVHCLKLMGTPCTLGGENLLFLVLAEHKGRTEDVPHHHSGNVFVRIGLLELARCESEVEEWSNEGRVVHSTVVTIV